MEEEYKPFTNLILKCFETALEVADYKGDSTERGLFKAFCEKFPLYIEDLYNFMQLRLVDDPGFDYWVERGRLEDVYKEVVKECSNSKTQE